MFSTWRIYTKSHDYQWYIIDVDNSINIMEICWQDPSHSLHWRTSRAEFSNWINTRLRYLDFTKFKKIPISKINSKRFCWPKPIPKGLKQEIKNGFELSESDN